MRSFKELEINVETQSLIGDKIKMSRILNREITVHGYKIEDSKYEGKGKCLYIQIGIGETKHVVFTGSKYLMAALLQTKKGDFPFMTTIIEDNESFKFT